MVKMVNYRWLRWINSPNSESISVTQSKQEQEVASGCLRSRKIQSRQNSCLRVGLSVLCLSLLIVCVALSVLYKIESNTRPGLKRLLLDYHNISESYLILTKVNADLRADKEMLKEHSAQLEEQTKLLNRTSAKLMSDNLVLTSNSTKLMEQIVNLTSTNFQLMREHERLVQHAFQQEEEKLNMSQTIKHLVDSNALREEEQRQLSEISLLLRDELSQLKERNRELSEINNRYEGEIKKKTDCEKVSESNMELWEQNQNLHSTLMAERQKAVESKEQMIAEINSTGEALHSLDLYCPVVNHKTKERVCKKCQESWQLFDNKCYYFSSHMSTWASSRAWCQTHGGDLLIVNSKNEQNFVLETSRALDQSNTRLWIGLTDAEDEGKWVWVDGRTVTTGVQYWLSRPESGAEPDDWKLNDPLGEDCGHIDTSEETEKSWMDGSCKIPYRWICEKMV